MQINKDIVAEELDKFIGNIFFLPEVICVKIRDVSIYKNETRDGREEIEVSGGFYVRKNAE